MSLFREVAVMSMNLTYHTEFHFGFALCGHFAGWDDDMKRANRWCVKQFGPEGSRWKCAVAGFMFMDENDAFAFKLQWC